MVNGWDDYPPLGFICSPFFKIPLFLVLGMRALPLFVSFGYCILHFTYCLQIIVTY